MKQIKSLELLEGKVISKVIELNMDKMFIIFKDDSFCVIRGGGWEEPYVELDIEEYNLEPCEWNYKDLFELGFIDENKYEVLSKKYRLLNEERRRKAELEKLEILKQKYPEQFK